MEFLAGKLRYWLFILLVSMTFGWVLTKLPLISVLLDSLNQRLYDTILIITAKDSGKKTLDDIVIVDIDEKSIQTLGQFSTWPNLYFADALNYLESGKPAAVGFDIFFTESDSIPRLAIRRLSEYLQQTAALDKLNSARVLARLSTDALLAEAISKGGNVFLAMFNQNDIAAKPAQLPSTLKEWQVKPIISYAVHSPVPPIPVLAESAYGVGFAHIEPNRLGVVHEYPLFFDYQGRHYANFSFQMCLDLLGIDEIRAQGNKVNLYQKKKLITKLPLDEYGKFYLKYYGAHQTFRTIAFSDVLLQRIPAEYFNAKIILFGSSATGLSDIKTTPLDAQFPGVELHATFIQNVLSNDFVRFVTPLMQYFLALLVLGLMVWITRRFAPFVAFIIYFCCLLLSFVAFVLIYHFYSLSLNYLAFILPWNFGFFLSVFLQYNQQLREKRNLRNFFEHFVAKDVVKEIIENPTQLRLGGKESEVTALFSDIRNFTSLCEDSSPREIVVFLNDYFNRITPTVIKTHGMLDKYIGDAMVALYNVPLAKPEYTYNCCIAALEIERIANEIRLEHASHPVFSEFCNGIGITTGCLIVGYIGSDHILSYTGIGDIMNLASRLEGLNKYYGTRIIMDEPTYEAVKDQFYIRRLDCVAVKGKQNCTMIYELVAAKNLTDGQDDIPLPADIDKIELYEAAYDDFQKGAWESALIKFKAINVQFPNDNPTQMMIERISKLDCKPPCDFQGYWVYLDK
jgi:adenylate cyclase